MVKRWLHCRECDEEEQFDDDDAVVESDWADINRDGRRDSGQDDAVHHEAYCPDHSDMSPTNSPDPEDDDSWVPSVGDRVEIAQADLPHLPRMEHETGKIVELDVDNATIIKMQRANQPTSMIEMMLSGSPSGRYDVGVYADPGRNEETTFHLVGFEPGAYGVYPERCLVPRPEEII